MPAAKAFALSWLNDNLHPEQMGKLIISADKKLEFNIQTVPLAELTKDVEKIEIRRAQMGGIREEIKQALPTLPEISDKELNPIIENYVY